MDTLIESMTRIHTEINGVECVVRCWREQDDYNLDVADDAYAAVYRIVSVTEKLDITFLEVAKRILDIARMNAVEIVNDYGNGVVLYRVGKIIDGVKLL